MQRMNVRLLKSVGQWGYPYGLLAVVTLAGGALRFYKLGVWSFWGDEVFTVGSGEDGFNYSVLRRSLSLVLVRAVVNELGVTEWNARLVPALIGVISIPALYFLARRMFNPSAGLVAASLLALSPWHLYWSQNARFYTALFLLYTSALVTFYIGLEEDRPGALAAALVLLGLAVKERLIALFFIPVALGYVALLEVLPFEKPRGLRWRRLGLTALAGVALAGLFLRPYVLDLAGWRAGFGRANNSPLWILAAVAFYIGVPTLCMGASGALYLLIRRHRASLLLILGAVIPWLTLAGIAPFHYTATRYAFICLGSWIILAAVAAVELLAGAQGRMKALAAGPLLFLLLAPVGEDVLYFGYQKGNREDWRAAFQLVKDRRAEGDWVVAADPDLGRYYLGEAVVDWRRVGPADVERAARRVWFVEDSVARGMSPPLHRWLEERAQLVANLDVHVRARNFYLRVYLYDPGGCGVGPAR